MGRAFTLAAAAIFIAVSTGPGEARNRGSDVSINDCLTGRNDNMCDGEICYCCYEDGCWICGFDEDGNAYQDCVWDPAYRRINQRLQKLVPGVRPQTLEPGQSGPVSRPPAFRPGGVIQRFQQR